MNIFQKGQKVHHPDVTVEMEVMVPPGLAAVATSSGKAKSSSVSGKTICSYTQNGRKVQKSFNTNELNLVNA